jgi:hypothetical protein
MKRACVIGITVVGLIAGGMVHAQSPRSAEVQMKTAQHKAEVEGDLKGAIEQYKRIVAAAGNNRALAAQALVAMADCYQKLGDAEAQRVYQRIVRDYSDQKDTAALARSRLGGVATTQPLKGITLRRVWDGRATDLTAAVVTRVSADGRHVVYNPWATGTVNLHDLTTGTDRTLVAGDNCSGPSAISRDGTQVAYERYCAKFGSELRLVNVRDNGVPASRLVYENADVAQITPMDVSPDGSLIAVTLVRKDRSKQIGLVTAGSGLLRVFKVR